MWEIRPERSEDHDAIRVLHRRAFDPSPGEAALVDALREGGHLVAELCLVAHTDRVIGHIAYSRARVGEHDVLALAPMAVLREHQRSGVGSALVEASLERAKRTSFAAVVVLGHPEFYPRFGFVPARPMGIDPPFPAPDEAWMALPLVRGTVEYAEPFGKL